MKWFSKEEEPAQSSFKDGAALVEHARSHVDYPAGYSVNDEVIPDPDHPIVLGKSSLTMVQIENIMEKRPVDTPNPGREEMYAKRQDAEDQKFGRK